MEFYFPDYTKNENGQTICDGFRPWDATKLSWVFQNHYERTITHSKEGKQSGHCSRDGHRSLFQGEFHHGMVLIQGECYFRVDATSSRLPMLRHGGVSRRNDESMMTAVKK